MKKNSSSLSPIFYLNLISWKKLLSITCLILLLDCFFTLNTIGQSLIIEGKHNSRKDTQSYHEVFSNIQRNAKTLDLIIPSTSELRVQQRLKTDVIYSSLKAQSHSFKNRNKVQIEGFSNNFIIHKIKGDKQSSNTTMSESPVKYVLEENTQINNQLSKELIEYKKVLFHYWFEELVTKPILIVEETRLYFGPFYSSQLNYIHKEIDNQTILAYPSPASDQLTVQLLLEKPAVLSVKLIDIEGGKVYISQDFGLLSIGIQTTTLDVSSLESGIYLVSVLRGKDQLFKKIIIQ